MSILIMGWGLISEKPKAKGQETNFAFADNEGGDTWRTKSPWVSSHAPSWIGRILDDVIDGFRKSAERDAERGAYSGSGATPWFTLKFNVQPKMMMGGGGGGVDLSSLRLTTNPNASGAGGPAAAPSAPSSSLRGIAELAAGAGSAAAARPAIPPPAPAAPSAAPARVGTRPEAVELPRLAQRAAPVEAPAPPPGKRGPEEVRLNETLQATRIDFRRLDDAMRAFRQFLATNPPGIARADYERRISDLVALKIEAGDERSSFNANADSLTPANLGAAREASIRDCMATVGAVRTVLIARKTVTISPTVPAYIALVDAPGTRPEAVGACLKALNSDGTLSLVLNAETTIMDAMTTRLRETAGTFSYPAP